MSSDTRKALVILRGFQSESQNIALGLGKNKQEITENIDVSLAKKIHDYLLGISDECITVDDILKVINHTNYDLDISRCLGININIAFQNGIEKYKIDAKQFLSMPDKTEEDYREFLRKTVELIKDKHPEFEPIIDIDDIDVSKGWEAVYNLLFKGFYYEIYRSVKRSDGTYRMYFLVNALITDNEKTTTCEIKPNFTEGTGYSEERLEEINATFKEATKYAKTHDIFKTEVQKKKTNK